MFTFHYYKIYMKYWYAAMCFPYKTVFLLLGTKEKKIPGHKEKGIKKKTQKYQSTMSKTKNIKAWCWFVTAQWR